ncbi:L-asparaginase [Lutibacter oricola]|uniref:asparaginase n=1 Tax=Lutibacter oricola TaxID=762486 RepID=A0A1H3DWS1_9FLAO|nr:asparaginase [Lutibacter oricola]SDX70876.1 L-asparaginase [Lutibacter oricola]
MTKIPHIYLIYTGGTIGMVKDFETGALKAFNFDKLLKHVPELNHLNCTIDTFSFDVPIDSSDMDIEEWVFIAELIERNYEKYDGFVILHGSDTMAYTSSAFSFMFKNLAKPIIFTGSQLPIGDLRTDAKENLITSIEIAAKQNKDGKPLINEVCLYFEYKLYRANRTVKMNAEHFQAFSSPNCLPLAESGVHLKFKRQLLEKTSTEKKLEVRKRFDNNIAVLKLFPGITKQVVESVLNIEGLKGVVLETFGSGNATSKQWFLDLLQDAVNKEIKIINVTQCAGGSVIMGKYNASVHLDKMGVISGFDITSESALVKLMYMLGMKVPNNEFKSIFESPLRGELTILE